MEKDKSGILEAEVVLAMDLASFHSGWALFQGKKLIASGSIFSKASASMQARAIHLYDSLEKLLDEYKPQHFVIEDQFLNPIFKNAMTLKTLSKFAGIALLCSARRDLEMQVLSPTEIKKEMTGKGNAKKEDVIAAVLAQYDFTTTNDNIADAIAVGTAYIRKRECDANRMSSSHARTSNADVSGSSQKKRVHGTADDAGGRVNPGRRGTGKKREAGRS